MRLDHFKKLLSDLRNVKGLKKLLIKKIEKMRTANALKNIKWTMNMFEIKEHP